MYFISSETVNGVIVGSGDSWLVFIEIDNGLRQVGGFYRSSTTARTALEVR